MYYIYENWTAEHKAVIHKGSCGYCNDGTGCHRNPLGQKNGQWHGPFKKLQEAETVARATKRNVKKHSCLFS